MWDRLLIDCHIATMDPSAAAPFGAIENGAVGIQDGRIVRVGRRTELAGYQARSVEKLDGAWVTPGLVDCHTHLVFAGNRAHEFEAIFLKDAEICEPVTLDQWKRRGVAERAGEVLAFLVEEQV